MIKPQLIDVDSDDSFSKYSPQSFKDTYGEPVIKPFTYNPNKFILGLNPFTNTHFTISTREAFRAYSMAMTRTGKTFMIRRVIDMAYKSKWNVAVMPDAKNEYGSSLKQVQEKFKTKLPDGDIPQALKMRIFRPLFFNTFDKGKLPKNNEHVSLEMRDLNVAEFQTLCNYTNLTDSQKVDYVALTREMEEKDEYSVVDMKRICEENNYTKLWSKLVFLETCGLFDSRYSVDPVKVMQDGNVLVLNYDGFDTLDLSNNSMDQIFMAVWLRKIIQARKDGKLNNLIIINDETARWVPQSGEPICKPLIMTSVERDAAYGISWWFGIQNKNSVPTDLLTQCKYRFFPQNIDYELFKQVLKDNAIITTLVTDSSKANKLYQNLQKKFRWMMINKFGVGDERISYVDGYPPTSAHQETKSSF